MMVRSDVDICGDDGGGGGVNEGDEAPLKGHFLLSLSHCLE